MRKALYLSALALAMAALSAASLGAEMDGLAELRQQIELMKKEYERRIRALEQRLKAAEATAKKAEAMQRPSTAEAAPTSASALDQAIAELEAPEAPTTAAAHTSDRGSRPFGRMNFRLLDIGLVTDVAAGWSSKNNDTVESLQGGAHDPQRRGFTLQQAELAFKGAVDPYLTGEAYVLFSEDDVELEEAFFTTTSLPYGLQLEGGFFLTEFGRNNPTHLDQWHWVDQPVINTRLFGGEGSRAAGFRLGWLMPTPWYSVLHVGAQNPTSEQMASFLGERPGEGHSHADEGEEDGIGGFAPVNENNIDDLSDLVYLGRWVNAVDLNPELSTQLGVSVLHGPNTTGSDGETWIYGMDLVAKWRPAGNFRGWPFLVWESEIMKRDYEVDRDNPTFEPGETDDTLRDWGLYTQLLYGFKYRWATGLRFEYTSGSGHGAEPRDEDPFRAERYRISPMLTYHPSEFSRLRLQYNYDHADFLDDDEAHTVWLGFEYILGTHPPHTY